MARAAELTRTSEPVTAADKPVEASTLRPGKAARAVVSDGRAVRDAIKAVLAAPGESREVARAAYEAVRDQLVADALDVMPVDRLRDLVRGKVTFAPLIEGDLETVGKVLAAGTEALRRIPGVRRRTARRIMAAAAQLRESVEDGTRVRLDPDARTLEQTALIAALPHRMGQVRPVDVHRLLCEDSVDQRILELLAGKREAFDEYARRSDMASATPDAVATGSETEVRRTILAAERTRLKAA